MDSTHPMGSQVCMEFEFYGGHFTAQLSRLLEDFGSGAFMHLDPLRPAGTSPN